MILNSFINFLSVLKRKNTEYYMFKGTVNVLFQVTLHAERAMSDSQRYY